MFQSSAPGQGAPLSLIHICCGALSIEKLEAMTAVCSVGLDMIAIPGDTPAEVISAIIADEAAIGMVNSKTTAVRVIPAIGKQVGEELSFGGLLGGGPVMAVSYTHLDVYKRQILWITESRKRKSLQ